MDSEQKRLHIAELEEWLMNLETDKNMEDIDPVSETSKDDVKRLNMM